MTTELVLRFLFPKPSCLSSLNSMDYSVIVSCMNLFEFGHCNLTKKQTVQLNVFVRSIYIAGNNSIIIIIIVLYFL